jgi:aryl-alcohol dehydrogenase-like predicted oxidoreductase
MAADTRPGGTFTMGGDLTVTRMGYGAMQLAGPGVFGPPADRDAAVAVLREAVELGITHIDTSGYYGPRVTNQIIREALYPYPEDLRIVTKVGAERDASGGWLEAQAPEQLRAQVEENLRDLGLDAMDVVNLRNPGQRGPQPGSIAGPFTALAELRQKGLIRHLGVSNVTAGGSAPLCRLCSSTARSTPAVNSGRSVISRPPRSAKQVAEAHSIAPVACVQNHYNLANRGDDDLIGSLAAQGIAYVPFFPLGGFNPLQSGTLDAIAERLGAARMTVALAWLLHQSPNILLIPGTSSVAHLRENVAAADLALPADALAELGAIAT